MNIAIDQLSKATKSQAEAQLHAMSTIAEKAMHVVTELAELNVATVKASLEDSSAIASEIMSAKDPQAAMIIVQSQAQPAAEKAASYGRHLAAIASKAQAELGKVAQERVAETTAHFNALVNDLGKAAPAGSEPMVDMFKTNVATFNAMFEQFSKVGQSAYDQFQSQVSEVGSHFGVNGKPAKSKKAAAAA
jgi:phasin family protein